MAVAIARLSAVKGFEFSPYEFPGVKLRAHWGNSTLHRSRHWEVGIGTLGEYLRGKTTLHSLDFVVLFRIVILRFSGNASGVVAEASDLCLLLATGLCMPGGGGYHPIKIRSTPTSSPVNMWSPQPLSRKLRV